MEWLAKMKRKIEIDNNIMDMPWRCMAYVMNRMGGMAFGHLEPRAWENGPARPWKDSNKMLAYLECVFGDPNRRQNAKYKFRVLYQTGDFNTFWAEFFWLSIELDRNKSTLISNLTFKLSHDVRQQLINGNKPPINLFKYAEQCQRVYQGLKDLAHAEAEVLEECVVALTRKVSSRTIRTARSSCQPVISEKDQLMKEERCFLCRKVGHRTIDCPSEQKLRNKLSVSRMTMQKLEQKKSRTKASQAEVPHAEKSCAKKPHAAPCVEEPLAEMPLIVSSSLLPGNFFAEKALVTSCMLENHGEIKTTALLDTGATRYSFVDPVMAWRICDDLLLEPIRLSKPKALCGFNRKRAPDVTHVIYPTMTI